MLGADNILHVARNCQQVAGKGLKSPFLGREAQSEERRDVGIVDKLLGFHKESVRDEKKKKKKLAGLGGGGKETGPT